MSRLSRLLAVAAAMTLLLSGAQHAQAAELEVVLRSPTTGASAEVGVPILVAGATLSQTPSAIITTELTFDGGATWETTELQRVLSSFRTDWRYVYTPEVAGDVTIVGRAVTAAGPGPASAPVVVHVGGTAVTQPVNCSLKCQFVGPYGGEGDEDPDTQPVEVGLKVRFDRPGHVTGAALLRGRYRGPITVRLWSGEGELLHEQPWTHPGRMAQFDFTTPVVVEANRDYVVSYYTPEGGYAISEYTYLGTVTIAPFIAPHDGTHGAGVYHYGVGGGFPTDSWHDSDYWIVPEFRG
jgi:Domain of unknown function (DUF4082)